jgi:hypothetical protein
MVDSGLWIDHHKPTLSGDGTFLTYLLIGSDGSCQIHIYNVNKINFINLACPTKLSGDMDNWDSSFDATAENIYWFNHETNESLQIINPLLN